MSAQHKTISGQIRALPGSRQVRAIISTESPDRVGDIVRSKGCDATGFLSGGSILWNHDQDHPVARCVGLDIGFGQITSTAEFPDPGVSAKADEVYGLIKAGVVNATSIGFIPTTFKPLGKGKMDVTAWTLLEWSFVSCPANDGAQITQRAARHAELTAADELRLARSLDTMVMGGGSPDPSILVKLSPARLQRIRGLEVAVLRGR